MRVVPRPASGPRPKNLPCYNDVGLKPHHSKGGSHVAKNTLSHTTWECKYHIVFAPKFRRQIIYGKIKADVAHIISTLWAETRSHQSTVT